MCDYFLLYKVLWVDDDLSIVDSTILDAEEYNLELIHKDNWVDAEKYLRENFEDISAIILDANCKIRKGDLEGATFIGSILPRLTAFFGEKQAYIPWFILSAGTMDNFNFVVETASNCHKTEYWGQMMYTKGCADDAPNSSSNLFKNIQRIAEDSPLNTILYRHKDVFQYVGDGKLIDKRAYNYLLHMLSALYYPEENIGFQFEGNPLRKVLEYVFRAANRNGLLPDECIGNGDKFNLLESNRYMSGLNTRHSNVRYGKPGKDAEGRPTSDGRGGESIFPTYMGYMSQAIIQYTNTDSHTVENNPYTIESSNKEMFFGYLLHLCHIIKWFGEYVSKHPNVETNRSMVSKVSFDIKGLKKNCSQSSEK